MAIEATTLPNGAPGSFIAALRQRQSRVGQRRASRGYNYPRQAYMRTDGEIVLLPGDPQSQAYYTGKGFTVLNQAEYEDWVTNVRPVEIERQRAKARVIQAIRDVQRMHPTARVPSGLERFTTEQLEGLLGQMQDQFGQVFQIFNLPEPAAVAWPPEPADPLAAAAEAEAERGDGGDLRTMIDRSRAAGHRPVMGGEP